MSEPAVPRCYNCGRPGTHDAGYEGRRWCDICVTRWRWMALGEMVWISQEPMVSQTPTSGDSLTEGTGLEGRVGKPPAASKHSALPATSYGVESPEVAAPRTRLEEIRQLWSPTLGICDAVRPKDTDRCPTCEWSWTAHDLKVVLGELARVEQERSALVAQVEVLTQLLAQNLKVDGWDPPLVNWLKTPEEAMRAMTLNMSQSRDEMKHQNRALTPRVQQLEQAQADRQEPPILDKNDPGR